MNPRFRKESGVLFFLSLVLVLVFAHPGSGDCPDEPMIGQAYEMLPEQGNESDQSVQSPQRRAARSRRINPVAITSAGSCQKRRDHRHVLGA